MSSTVRPASTPDVVVIGSGPNGLTAAVLLARAGLSVRVIEAADIPGGGCRSSALTLPGFVHDTCAAVHPMGVLSPVFRDIALEKFGLEWVWSRRPLAHPLPDGRAAVLDRSLDRTRENLGKDGAAWERLLAPFANEAFIRSLLQPIWRLSGGAWFTKARFGLSALQSCERLARSRFEDAAARALFAGCAAHSVMSLDSPGTASFGLVLAAAAHAIDWPCARGGSQEIVNAMIRALEQHGGSVETGRRVDDVREFSNARAVLFDLSPVQIARIAAAELPDRYPRTSRALPAWACGVQG